MALALVATVLAFVAIVLVFATTVLAIELSPSESLSLESSYMYNDIEHDKFDFICKSTVMPP